MKKAFSYFLVTLMLASCNNGNYDQILCEAYSEAYYVAVRSKQINEKTVVTWSTAINEHKDHNGNYCSDFNDALRTLFKEFNDASVYDSLNVHYQKMDSLSKILSDYPSNKKDVFNDFVSIVSNARSILKYASDPSGNLQQFSQESRQASSDFEKDINQFDIKYANILTNVKKGVIPLSLELGKYKLEKKSILSDRKIKELEFLLDNAKKEGVVQLPSGLQIKTILEGTGKTPSVSNKVNVNYVGKLIDGTIFDSNDNIDFNVSGVISGYQEGLQHMKEGGKAIFYFPSDLGYGDDGIGKIPGGATLIFEVTLNQVK